MIYSTFLFLDFDGVVHKKVPENSADIFRGLAVLSKVLRLFPPIGIVISSTWKQYPRDLEFAISQFPSGLRDAIVDKTPNLGGKRTRELEIITWMRSNAVLAMNTIVLDDEPNLFDELRNIFSAEGTH